MSENTNDLLNVLQQIPIPLNAAIGEFVSVATLTEAIVNSMLTAELTPIGPRRAMMFAFEIVKLSTFKQRCLLLEELLKTYEVKEICDEFHRLRVRIDNLFEFRNLILHNVIFQEGTVIEGKMIVLGRVDGHPTGMKQVETRTVTSEEIMANGRELTDVLGKLNYLHIRHSDIQGLVNALSTPSSQTSDTS